jgi:uncharacterized lipoprotein
VKAAGTGSQLRIAVLLLAAVVLSACSRNKPLGCGGHLAYLQAETADQLRVPDDLTVPDESDSLRIPPVGPGEPAATDQVPACLEESPAFSRSPEP